MMATPVVRETPKPRYSGTVVCEQCYAEYKPGNWCVGIYPSFSTDGVNYIDYKIPDELCPVCRKKK